MYVEDDVLVRWDSVLAWAEDDALLAPLGFQRGFFRTEFNVQSGARSRVHDTARTCRACARQYWCFITSSRTWFVGEALRG